MIARLTLASALLGAGAWSADLPLDWEALGPDGGNIHILALDPRQPDHILAASRHGGLFEYQPAAAQWRRVFPGLAYDTTIHALMIDPENGHWWLGVKDPSGKRPGLRVSADGGASWQPVPAFMGRSVLSLAANGAEFAAGADDGVYASKDSGGVWTRLSPAGHPELKSVVSLAFDTRSPGVLYAGTTHLPWKTASAGRSWSPTHTGILDDSDVFSILADPHHPGRVYLSACSGIYWSRNSGAQWTRVRGIPSDNRRTYAIRQDPAHPNRIYAGTTAGLWHSPDAGATWTKLDSTPVNWLEISSSALYVATDGAGVLRSTDGGRTFAPFNSGLHHRAVSTLALAEGSLLAATTYEGSFGGLFRSSDLGASWELATAPELQNANIRRLSTNGARVEADTFSGLLVSSDSGQKWTRSQRRATPLPPLPHFAGLATYQVAAAPDRPLIRLAATSQDLRRSVDGGRTWFRAGDGLDAEWYSAVVFHPARPGEVYVANGLTLYRSFDYGEKWVKMPVRQTAGILLKSLHFGLAEPDILFAISRDSGVFRLRLNRPE